MGRKSTLTKSTQAQIVEILEAGNYQKTAYESLGIPEATYYSWLKEGEKAESKGKYLTKKQKVYLEFSESIKKAVQKARQKNLKCIQDATIGGAILSETEYYDKEGNVTSKKTVYSAPNWYPAAWFLERTDFDEFGNKSKLEHTGRDGKAMVFKVVYDD